MDIVDNKTGNYITITTNHHFEPGDSISISTHKDIDEKFGIIKKVNNGTVIVEYVKDFEYTGV